MDDVFMGRVLAVEAAVAQLLALSNHDLTAMHERGCKWLEEELNALSGTTQEAAETVATEVVRDIATTNLDQLFAFALQLRNHQAEHGQPSRAPDPA